ncbi:serine/threonine protein kinase [Bacillus sp. PK9-021]
MHTDFLTIEDVQLILSNCKEKITDLEYLDRGGQKLVFKCSINGIPYALKFCDVTEAERIDPLYPNQESDESAGANSIILSRAQREIDIMDRVDSPTLVKLGPLRLNLVDYNTKKILYFSEEFIPGKDLYSILRENKLSYTQTIDLAIDISTAIHHLWEINMVHRDIKPKNIMLKDNGQFVLLDTGIAFDIQGETLTAAFHLVGTKIYMSPEQLSGYRRELDFRSDLFLLGIVMYEAVTGNHPFYQPGFHTYQIINNITTSELIPPSHFIKDFPKKLERIIMRLLAKEPHLRYKSCDQLLKQLNGLKETL